MVKLKKIVKNQKLKISNFEVLAPIGSHVKEKEKQNLEKSKTQNFKNPKQYLYFCEDHWEKNSEKVWKDLKMIWGDSSVLKFSLAQGRMLTKTKNIHKKKKK